MSRQAVRAHDTITTDTGAAVNGKPVYVGGNVFSVQTVVVGGTVAAVQISNDKANWVDADTSLGNAITSVTSRPLYARGRAATDAGGPREIQFLFAIFKETED